MGLLSTARRIRLEKNGAASLFTRLETSDCNLSWNLQHHLGGKIFLSQDDVYHGVEAF